MNKVLYPEDIKKLKLYSDRIRPLKELSDVSLTAGVELLIEMGFYFTGEYENAHNGNVEMSYDKFIWQNKSRDIGAVFFNSEKNDKRLLGRDFFDKVDENGKVIHDDVEALYFMFCEFNNYDNIIYNITALLKFANKLKIKTNLNSLKFKKTIRKAPNQSIEILKDYGFVF